MPDSSTIIQLLEENFVGVMIVGFLILFVVTNNNFEKRINRLFLAAACIVLLVIVEEAWEAQLALSPNYEPLRVLLSALGYTLRPAIPFLMILIAKKLPRKRLLLLSIPLILNALIAFSSLFCKISFGYSQENEFIRGPLGFTPFIVAGFYILLAIALVFQIYIDMGILEMLILSAIVLFTFLATILESIFHMQFIQCPCMATSLTFFYLFLHCNQNNRDPLTEALTRRRFYLDAKKNPAALSAVISLDLNDLKLINDQQSHMEGDKALNTVSMIIKQHKGVHAALYRVGGDEFIILCYKMKEDDIQKLIDKIRADLQKTPYRCAIGYAMNDANADFESVCHIADNLMYQNKREMKGNRRRS